MTEDSYELDDFDESDLAECLYESIREMCVNGEEIKLRPLSVSCGVMLSDLADRISLIRSIELLTKSELGIKETD